MKQNIDRYQRQQLAKVFLTGGKIFNGQFSFHFQNKIAKRIANKRCINVKKYKCQTVDLIEGHIQSLDPVCMSNRFTRVGLFQKRSQQAFRLHGYAWIRSSSGTGSYLFGYARKADPFESVPDPFLCKRDEIVPISYPKCAGLLDAYCFLLKGS